MCRISCDTYSDRQGRELGDLWAPAMARARRGPAPANDLPVEAAGGLKRFMTTHDRSEDAAIGCPSFERSKHSFDKSISKTLRASFICLNFTSPS